MATAKMTHPKYSPDSSLLKFVSVLSGDEFELNLSSFEFLVDFVLIWT